MWPYPRSRRRGGTRVAGLLSPPTPLSPTNCRMAIHRAALAGSFARPHRPSGRCIFKTHAAWTIGSMIGRSRTQTATKRSATSCARSASVRSDAQSVVRLDRRTRDELRRDGRGVLGGSSRITRISATCRSDARVESRYWDRGSQHRRIRTGSRVLVHASPEGLLRDGALVAVPGNG